jgi:DNA-binding NarL/FixJ family response regulator
LSRSPGASEAPPEPIRLVMVEPRALLGVGLREILDREPDIEVVAHVGSFVEALHVVDLAATDVVLVNSPEVGDGEGDATRRLRRESPETPFVVVGGDDDDASIVGAVEMGAMGHVAEIAEPEDLVATIRRVANGEDPLRDELDGRPDIVERVIESVRNGYSGTPPENPLTPREIDVLSHVADGLRNREIAEALDCSEQTIKNHLRAAMHKLGAPNRTRAVLSALRYEWLPRRGAPESEAARPAVRS